MDISGMAAMPLLYNGLLLDQLNVTRENLVFTLKSAKVHYYLRTTYNNLIAN